MTNGEKYKTAHERAEAFHEYCKITYGNCKFRTAGCADCAIEWLDIEAEEEKPLPCPFCGTEIWFKDSSTKGVRVGCDCGYAGMYCKTKVDAITAHNRVAKKCEEVKE